MYLETMLEDYLLELKLRNYSERTIKSARNTNRLYFKWLRSEFGIDEIEQIKKPHIKAYLKYKQEQGLSSVYINGIYQNTGTNKVKEGYIGLQSEGKEIQFRNVSIIPWE